MRSILPSVVLLLTGMSGHALAMPSPLQYAPQQVEPYLVRLAESPDFTAIYQQLKISDHVTFDNFPLSMTKTVTLDLRRFEVLKPGARVVDGSTGRELGAPDVVLLRGTANGDPSTSVFLSFSRYGHQGWVAIDGAQYLISTGPSNGPRIPVVYRLGDIPASVMTIEAPLCGGGLARIPGQVPGIPMQVPGGRLTPQGTCRTAEIAVESDYEYTSVIAGFGGDPVASAAYITTLFGAVSEIYQREFNTTVVVPYMRVFSQNNDPYPDMTNVPARLDQFQAEWNSHQTSVDRKVAHMLTAARVGGVGGIAYLNALCDSQYGYGVSGYISGHFPYPLADHNSQNWDIVVTSHEIGHNFGAPHTHDVDPPIDLCGYGDCTLAAQGTIMSYCHTCSPGMTNIALNMHPRIINEYVEPFLEYLTDAEVCSMSGGMPVITQNPEDTTAPIGGEAVFGVAAMGAPTLHYQWYHDGSTVFGGTGAVLRIDPVAQSSEGSYLCIVSNDCGDAQSNSATLTVSGRCYADFNEDLVVDFFDYLDFLAAFSSGSMAADVNADNVLDFFDYLDFLAQFANGGC